MGGIAVGISDEPIVVSFSSPVARNRWNDQLLQSLIKAVPTAIREGTQGGSSPVVLLGVLWPIRKKKGSKGEGFNDLQSVFGWYSTGKKEEKRLLHPCFYQKSTHLRCASWQPFGMKEGKGEVLPLSRVIRRVGDGGSHRFSFPCRWYPRT
ncbi:hypothetical protein Lser_V15G39671 [Lactuca serriola]